MEHVGGFHPSFGQGRMRVHGASKIGRGQFSTEGRGSFRDQLCRMRVAAYRIKVLNDKLPGGGSAV